MSVAIAAEANRQLEADRASRLATLKAIPGYPWLPCPICNGVEGCDHAIPERARAAVPGLVLRRHT